MLLAYRGLRMAMLNRRPFRVYLAAGITLLFSVQALLIMGGVTKLLPLTGVTLPFISYGGSSMLISSIMFGLLLHMSQEDSPGQQGYPVRSRDLTHDQQTIRHMTNDPTHD